MKKTVASLFLIFLTSCQIINNEKAQKSIDTFDVNDGCPYICWLGINPGKTTAAEAKQIISTSDQIDPSQLGIYDDIIVGVWTGETGTRDIVINILLESGVVKGISFAPFPSTVGELIDLFGSPSHISISAIDGYDGMHTPYMLYFQVTKTMILVPENLHQGPDRSNAISGLELNSQIDISNPPPRGLFFNHGLGMDI